MSSTEPPSRIPPRQQAHETKSARDELSSKGKVEKVREVDADEETKKRRFMKYYRGLEEEEPVAAETRPSPFDLYSGKAESTEEEEPTVGAAAPSTSDDFDDVEDAVIPAPSYTPPPDVHVVAKEGDEEDEATEGALPQSDDFWVDFDLPDQPIPQTKYSETGLRTFEGAPEKERPYAAKEEGELPKVVPVSEHRKRVKEIKKREEVVGLLKGKAEKKEEVHERLEKKKREPSPFGPPGKPVAKERERQVPMQAKEEGKPHTPPGKAKERVAAAPEEKEPVWGVPFREEKREVPSRAASKEKKLPTPMEELSKQQMKTPLPREAMPREAAPMARQREKPAVKKVEEERAVMPQEIGAAPVRPPEESEGGGGGKKGREREEKILEIEAPSLPLLPNSIQPMAMTATTQAAPYLSPQTVSLFFQMVGTIFVMTGPQGINRTEVVLNNPSYANSKFYGATITIEKYATAPDSFNIRLTGSHEAVASFKENIPSLLTAFENGNFNFRIGRIDVEYTLEKPIFRRKEKGEGKGETGSGDLGERRNK